MSRRSNDERIPPPIRATKTRAINARTGYSRASVVRRNQEVPSKPPLAFPDAEWMGNDRSCSTNCHKRSWSPHATPSMTSRDGVYAPLSLRTRTIASSDRFSLNAAPGVIWLTRNGRARPNGDRHYGRLGGRPRLSRKRDADRLRSSFFIVPPALSKAKGNVFPSRLGRSKFPRRPKPAGRHGCRGCDGVKLPMVQSRLIRAAPAAQGVRAARMSDEPPAPHPQSRAYDAANLRWSGQGQSGRPRTAARSWAAPMSDLPRGELASGGSRSIPVLPHGEAGRRTRLFYSQRDHRWQGCAPAHTRPRTPLALMSRFGHFPRGKRHHCDIANARDPGGRRGHIE
jgi:hypothetical protein